MDINDNDFFDALEKGCRKEGVCSVVETIEKLGVNCKEVLESTDKYFVSSSGLSSLV